jgi:hypothetical protein
MSLAFQLQDNYDDNSFVNPFYYKELPSGSIPIDFQGQQIISFQAPFEDEDVYEPPPPPIRTALTEQEEMKKNTVELDNTATLAERKQETGLRPTDSFGLKCCDDCRDGEACVVTKASRILLNLSYEELGLGLGLAGIGYILTDSFSVLNKVSVVSGLGIAGLIGYKAVTNVQNIIPNLEEEAGKVISNKIYGDNTNYNDPWYCALGPANLLIPGCGKTSIIPVVGLSQQIGRILS